MQTILEDFIKKLMTVTSKHVSKNNIYNISDKDFFILMGIYKLSINDEKVTSTLLASHFEFTVPAAMKHLKNLEEENLVQRIISQDDKRIKFYMINDEITGYLKEVLKESNEIKEKYFEYIGEKNGEVLKEILEKTIKFVEENL